MKSAYALAFDEIHRGSAVASSSSPEGSRKCWQYVWKCNVPPTVRNFARKLATDSLPTWRNKYKIGLEASSICPVCGTEEEDNFHPFVRCQFGRDLYLAMAEMWCLPPLESVVPNGKEWLLQFLAPLSDVQRSMVLLIFWRSWYVRNELTHSKPAPIMAVSKRFLQDYMFSLFCIKANPHMDPTKGKQNINFDLSSKSHVHTPAPDTSWKPAHHGWVKLNTDGSFSAEGGAGAGMILRDAHGNIIFSACRALYSCRDALEAELCACMEGLSFAVQRSDLPIEIEMDSSMAVEMISSGEVNRSIYASLIGEIKFLLSLRQSCITHVPRCQNKASDRLASFARIEGRTMTWVGSGTEDVLRIVHDDCKNLIIE